MHKSWNLMSLSLSVMLSQLLFVTFVTCPAIKRASSFYFQRSLPWRHSSKQLPTSHETHDVTEIRENFDFSHGSVLDIIAAWGVRITSFPVEFRPGRRRIKIETSGVLWFLYEFYYLIIVCFYIHPTFFLDGESTYVRLYRVNVSELQSILIVVFPVVIPVNTGWKWKIF